MLELQLLGPMVLRDGGTALPLAIKKTQALLLLLALQGSGSPVPRSRLVALLWPQLDEPTGRRNLRRELARLRELGAGAGLRAEGDGLALDAAVDCDLHRFEQALAAQRPHEALQFWRGPPADGLTLPDAEAFEEWWAPQRARLLELRRRALEACAADLEARGDIGAALQRTETLLAEDPLQESHHRGAMRLLAAAGRREAALAQYETCRRLLREELGLAPMADTERLAAQLREAGATAAAVPDPGAATARAAGAGVAAGPQPAEPPVPRSLLPPLLPFVGREAEVAALEMAWHAGRCVLIEAEGGIGKTRLAVDFAAAHGPYALVRARPSDAAVPYAAFKRALRALAGPAPDLQALPPWVQGELARLLPQRGPAPPPIGSAAERSRFIEACTLGWLELAADSFDAVILDDWQHADAASAELLAYIAQRRREAGAEGARELVLFRPEASAAVQDSLQRLRDSSDALHLRLPPLDEDAVLDLVRQLSGAADPARFSARLGRATRGNPFYLAETLRHLAEQRLLEVGADGVWHTPFDEATQDYRELPVPASVHAAVLTRVQRLGAGGRRVLEAAALAAEPFVPALLGPACALSELDTVLAIEQAVQAQLLREHDDGGYAFVHDLVQQALDASLGPDRRRLVHRRLALGAEAAGAAPAVIAAHHEASGDGARAVAHRLAAGDEAQRLHAQSEAMAHWQQALADGPTPRQAMDLHLRLMRTARSLNQREPGIAHAEALQALAAGPLLAAGERTDTLIAVARHLVGTDRAAEGTGLLDQLPEPMTERQQALVMAVRADALRRQGHVEEAMAAARAALALPGMQGAERATLLLTVVQAEYAAGRSAAALSQLDAAQALCRTLGDDSGIVRCMYMRGTVLAETGDPVGAEAALQDAATCAARFGMVGVQRAALHGLSGVFLEQNQAARALAVAREGWTLRPAITTHDMRSMYRSRFIGAHLALGELGAAWAHTAPALQEALAAREPPLMVFMADSCLELFGLLGEHEPARLLIGAVSEQAMRQMPPLAVAFGLARARWELLSGEPRAARRALVPVHAAAGTGSAAEQRQMALLSAEIAWAEGDAPGVAAALPPADAPGMNHEARLRCLALRVGAEAAAGALQPATVAAAQSALAADALHAVAALQLNRALAAARRAGAAGAPQHAERDCQAHVGRLAASLLEHPAQRDQFLRRWS